MRECRSYGSVRGAGSNARPYRDSVPRSARPRQDTLIDEVTAWETSGNKNHAKANWRLITSDAGVELKRCSPLTI